MEPKKKGGILNKDKNLNNPPHGNPVKKSNTKAGSTPRKQEKVEDDPKKKKEDKEKTVKEPIPPSTPAEVAADNPKGDDDYRKADQDKDLLM